MVVLAHTEAVIAPGQSCQSPPASPLSSPSPPSCPPRCRRSCWLFGLHLLLPLPPTRGAVLPAAQSRLVTRTARCSRVPAALGYLPPAGVASPSRRARCGVAARRHPPPPPHEEDITQQSGSIHHRQPLLGYDPSSKVRLPFARRTRGGVRCPFSVERRHHPPPPSDVTTRLPGLGSGQLPYKRRSCPVWLWYVCL